MNDCDWILAEDIESAKKYYIELTEIPADEAFCDEGQVPDELLDTIRFYLSDDWRNGPWITFRDRMREMMIDGCDVPCFFATTEQ